MAMMQYRCACEWYMCEYMQIHRADTEHHNTFYVKVFVSRPSAAQPRPSRQGWSILCYETRSTWSFRLDDHAGARSWRRHEEQRKQVSGAHFVIKALNPIDGDDPINRVICKTPSSGFNLDNPFDVRHQKKKLIHCVSSCTS